MAADEYDVLLNSLSPTPPTAPKPQPSVDYRSLYNQVGQKYGVDPDLLYNQAKHESVNFNPKYVYGPSRSPKGAAGLAQFMPDTARQYGLQVGKGTDDRFNPTKAADAHGRLMKDLIDKYGDTQLALAAYNSGTNKTPEQARRAMQRIPETRGYVQKIAPQGDAYDQLLNEQSGQSTRQAKPAQRDDYDSLLDSISGQTPPPQTNEARVTPSPAANAAATQPQPRQPSVPITDALTQLNAKINRDFARRGLKPPTTSPEVPLQLPQVNKNLGALPTEMVQAANSPAASERQQVANQVAADRAARRGAYGQPTLAGIKRAVSQPAEALASLGMTDEEAFGREVDQAMESARQQRRPEVEAQAKIYRQRIRDSGGLQNVLSGGKWTREVAAQIAAPLTGLAAGVVAATDPASQSEALRNTLVTHAAALAQAAEEEGADRGTASKFAQHFVSGTIASLPEMGAMALGVPAPLAFGTSGALQAAGRGEGLEGAAKGFGESAASAAPFELPVSGNLTGAARKVAKGATVGAGTTALELAKGQPLGQAAQSGLTNALMSGALERGESPRQEAIRGRLGELQAAAGPRGEPSETTPTQPLPEVAAQPEATAPTKAGPTFLHDDQGNPVARVLNPEAVAQGEKPQIRPIHQADTQVRDEAGRFAEQAPEPTNVGAAGNAEPRLTAPAASEPESEQFPQRLDRQDIVELIDRNSPGRDIARMYGGYRGLREKLGDEPFVLVDAPISKLRVEEYDNEDVDPSRAIPSNGPIVVNPNGGLMDGRHRTALAAQEGRTTIPAYVPESLAKRWATEEEVATPEPPSPAPPPLTKEAQPKEAARTPTVLREANGDRGGIVAPSPTEPNGWRLTRFDSQGFSGHAEYKTREAALKDAQKVYQLTEPMSQQGFADVASTERFTAGNELSQFVNKRDLTSEDQARIAELNRKLAPQPKDSGLPPEIVAQHKAPYKGITYDFGASDRNAGSPRGLEALRSWPTEQLRKEEYEMMRASSNRMFGHNAEAARKLVEQVLNERKQIEASEQPSPSQPKSKGEPTRATPDQVTPPPLTPSQAAEGATAPPLPPTRPSEPVRITAARERLAKQPSTNLADFFKSEKGEFDPQQLIDYLTVHGYDLYQSGKTKVDDWRKEMRDRFGERAEPYLDKAWANVAEQPSTTSARKEQMASDRAELDLPELPAPERKSWQKSLSEAKPEDANRLADEVLEKPRPLNDAETASIVTRAQQIKNDLVDVRQQLSEAKGDDIAPLANQAKSLQAEFDKLTDAAKRSGTEKGRTLAAQKLTINQDFDLTSLNQRLKEAKGSELTEAETTRNAKAAKQIADLQSQLAKANEKLAHQDLQRQIDRVNRRQQRAQTRSSLDDEFAQLRTQFAQARAETRGVQPSGLAGLDPEGKLTKIIGQMARNRVKAGVTDAAQLVDDIHAAVSEHLEGLSKRDVRDAISGYGIEPQGDKRGDAAKQLASMRGELKRLSTQEDITAGKRLNPRDKARQAQLQKQSDELQRRLEQQDFAAAPKRIPPTYSRETRALEEQVARLKLDFERQVRRAEEASRSKPEKAADLLVRWGRAAKLSYVSTLGKLSSAATGRMVMSPLENLVGEIPHRLSPELSRRATTEGGGFDRAAEVAALWKSGRFKQVLNQITKGSSDLDVLYGPRAKMLDKEMSGEGILGIPGRVHGALKEYPRQAEFDRAFIKTLRSYERSGQDIGDPAVQLSARMEAYNSAERARFQQRNFISDTFNNTMRDWERRGGIAKGLAKVGKFVFPITRVPVNVVGETLNYTFGLPRAAVETAVRGGVKNLTPEQANNIMRAYKKGGVGLAMMAYAFLNPQQFGGYYQKGEKRDPNQPQPEEVMFFGQRIPKWATHIPIIEAGQLAATVRRVWDAQKGKTESPMEAAASGVSAGAKGMAQGVPFYETPARFFSGQEGPRGVAQALGEQARGMIPGFVQEAAQKLDRDAEGKPIKRTPQGTFGERFGQTIKLGVPGLREQVPINRRGEKSERKATLTDQYRSGKVTSDDLKSLVDNETITEADKSAIEKQGALSPSQAQFANIQYPSSALDRYERMTATQRADVEDLMTKKAKSLVNSKSLTPTERDKFRERLEKVGIYPE